MSSCNATNEKPEKRFVLDQGQAFGQLFAPTGRVVDVYQSHFVGCPQADEHRRPLGTPCAKAAPMPHASPHVRLLAAQLELEQPAALRTVRAALRGHTVPEAAESLGVPARTLYRWLVRWPHLLPADWHDGRWVDGQRARVA